MLLAAILASPLLAAPAPVSAEGLFDFFFGGMQQRPQRDVPQQANSYADPFTGQQNPAVQPQYVPPTRSAAAGGSGPAFCVRSCDGKYFPLMRGLASPAQMCQAFCPASTTKVYFGSSIDGAYSQTGERYADSENAFAYRKALRADCTCNGREPAGLAPVDLALDSSLKAGDVIATTDGLVAYTGVRLGQEQTAEFTPVASYPGLTAQVRARLGEMRVAPVRADTVAADAPSAEIVRETLPDVTAPKSPAKSAKRAGLD
ncbi:DUF2865 domain-containing protein [Bradyrhizobium sp. GCM10027634]|uniref:DUF2865 domain-containing protein n=1 Tax=unclassified Bradyrhizobium TaxID=2631580 RepID=UPI00188AA633|nr:MULTISPECIES: DUF2865 domain-containing protein [unclassified Bradyrhizobium]MDN5000547.1 DUF2865 domain-containing protein [Bradyrhizobium sp. WYCCWR 12677]QOZ42710.1 hypothetical protein XH89_03945 [Bradyrhizobium sp. CCBAU 53340]